VISIGHEFAVEFGVPWFAVTVLAESVTVPEIGIVVPPETP
jgi:hypothetical protein